MTKLGLNIRNFGPAASPEHFRAWAEFAEGHGFALAMISDHVAVTPEVAALYPEPFYDPFATISWLAGLTSRLTFGTSVAILPLRHPLLTARMVRNLDQLSGGRFVFGVGVGWSQEEYAAVGVQFRERGRILDERLTELTKERPPGVPIWVGGASLSSIRRAARFGDAWHPINVQVSWVRETGLPALHAEAERLGRPVPAFAPRIRGRGCFRSTWRRTTAWWGWGACVRSCRISQRWLPWGLSTWCWTRTPTGRTSSSRWSTTGRRSARSLRRTPLFRACVGETRRRCR